MTPKAGICGACGEPVLWARAPGGHTVPLDMTPSSEGRWQLLDGRIVPLGTMLAARTRYTSHLITCRGRR